MLFLDDSQSLHRKWLEITKHPFFNGCLGFQAQPCRLYNNYDNNNKPIGSMYGIFIHIYHTNQPNVGKYTIHGSYGKRNTRFSMPNFSPLLALSTKLIRPYPEMMGPHFPGGVAKAYMTFKIIQTYPQPKTTTKNPPPPLSTTLAIKVFRISTSQRLIPWSWGSITWPTKTQRMHYLSDQIHGNLRYPPKATPPKK